MFVKGTYSWKQCESSIDISIPLKGTSPKLVDVLLTETYLKVSFRPFLLEIDLLHCVDDRKSQALIKDGILLIHLIKSGSASIVTWDFLEFEGTEQMVADRRVAALTKREKVVREMHEKAKQRRVDDQRMTLRHQMELERDQRKRLDELKAKEKREAEEEVLKGICCNELHQNTDETSKSSKLDEERSHRTQESSANLHVSTPASIKVSKAQSIPLLPPPRLPSRSTFRYTPRIFKTPSRESTISREEIFIIKNRPFLRKNKLLNTDHLDISESDSIWLKRKADEFVKMKDYRSAVNAYSSALDIDTEMVESLLGRAECYMELCEYAQCVSDYSAALELFRERDDSNESNISYVLRRRSIAYCHNENFADAKVDFKDLLSIIPSDTDKLYLDRLSSLLECSKKKCAADNALKAGLLNDALRQYNECVSAFPLYVGPLANKAACLMGMGQFQECVDTCSHILKILSTGISEVSSVEGNEFGLIPSKGSLKNKSYMICIFSRRGAAKECMKDIKGALLDLRAAAKLTSRSSKEKRDLEKDIKRLSEMHED